MNRKDKVLMIGFIDSIEMQLAAIKSYLATPDQGATETKTAYHGSREDDFLSEEEERDLDRILEPPAHPAAGFDPLPGTAIPIRDHDGPSVAEGMDRAMHSFLSDMVSHQNVGTQHEPEVD